MNPPTPNTNWYHPQQSGGGFLGNLGTALPGLASLGVSALAPEASVPAMALRSGLAGAGGSVLGRLMGGTPGNVIQSAIGGAEQGGQFSALRAVGQAMLDANNTGGVNESLEPILSSLGNNPKKVAQSGLRQADEALQGMNLDVTPENMQKVGGEGIKYLNDILDNAVKEAGPVDVSEMRKYAVAPEAEADINRILGRAGLLNTTAAFDPLQQLDGPNARKLITAIGKQAAYIKPVRGTNGAIDPIAERRYNDLMDAYSDLKDKVYGRPGVDQWITGGPEITPELIQEAGATKTPEIASYLANVHNSAGNGSGQPAHQDILDEMSMLMDMRKLGKAGVDMKTNVYPYMGNSKKPKVGPANPLANKGLLGILVGSSLGNEAQ